MGMKKVVKKNKIKIKKMNKKIVTTDAVVVLFLVCARASVWPLRRVTLIITRVTRVTVLTITLITPSGLDVVIASAFADVLAGTLAG